MASEIHTNYIPSSNLLFCGYGNCSVIYDETYSVIIDDEIMLKSRASLEHF